MAPSPASKQSLELLLLSPPPTEGSSSAHRDCYSPALEIVLSRVAQRASSETPCAIDIAVVFEDAQGKGVQAPRRKTYQALQVVIAGIYRLIVKICAEKEIDLDRGDRVDPRVIAVVGLSGQTQTEEHSKTQYVPQGPVVTLQNLADSTRAWDTVYATEGETGDSLLKNFTSLRSRAQRSTGLQQFGICRVPEGPGDATQLFASNALQADSDKRHYSVAVGGTFDHLHLGHRLLLTATALALDPPPRGNFAERYIVVGITGDELLKEKKYAEVLEDWDLRRDSVFNFLCSIMILDQSQDITIKHLNDPGPNGKATSYTLRDGLVLKLVEISDPFGPTITDESISALIVSGETRSGGKAVNDKRTEKGWKSLEVFEVDVLDANSEQETDKSSNFQSKLSSSEIRKRLQKSASNL